LNFGPRIEARNTTERVTLFGSARTPYTTTSIKRKAPTLAAFILAPVAWQ